MGSFWSQDEETEASGLSQQEQNAVVEIQANYKNPGVSISQDILRRIKLDKDLIKENNKILSEFLNSFTNKMKEVDDIFKLLFNRFEYTGSFYSELRISTPDEFDINLVLKLPFKDFEIIHQPQAPSYVKYQLKSYETPLRFPNLARLFIEDGFFIPENVRKWLQSVVDKALRTYSPPSSCIKVRTKQSGPARTILLEKRNGGQIDIDLVPVVECCLDLPRSSFDGRVARKVGNTLEAFLVPKPYSSIGRQKPISEKEARCLWRTHFPNAEKAIIHDLGCVKPIIKLLKFLRDKEDWKILASYYLKTLVMWMIIENDNKDYWKNDKIDERLLEALQKLKAAVREKKITYMFNKKYNLLEKLNDQQAFIIGNRLEIFITKYRSDPKYLWKFFKENPTFLEP